MAESRRQLKAMLRKNWLLKIRHPYATFAEIFLPTVVMLMLIAVRTQVDTRIHPAQPNIRKDMLLEVGKGDISRPFDQILELLVEKNEYLAFTPNSSETRAMINMLSLRFPLLKLVARVYKDELEFETYIRSDLYGTCNQEKNCPNPKIRGAVVFHSQGPKLYDYSIRLNHTWAFSGFPDVKSIMDVDGPYLNDLELGVNTVPILQYGFSGFLTLQQVLDSFIIFAAQESDISNISDGSEAHVFNSFDIQSSLKFPSMQFIPSNIRLVPFPTRDYTDDEFQFIIKKVMGVLYLLGFLYPISRLISYSVFEKEQKIKDGLYMMGLKSDIFQISWFITYVIQFAVSSGIITAFTMCSLFEYSDKSLVFVYFFFFGLSAITLSFLISTFFTRAKTAVAVGTLAFLGAFFPYYTVNDPGVPMVLKAAASLLSPTAFALGSINFADYERAHVGLRWSNIWRESSGVNFLVCLSMMVFDALLYGVIGNYLDKVLPKEDHAKFSWKLILPKCLWRNKDKIKPYSFESGSKVEGTSLEMKQQEVEGRCLQIRNLNKVYASKKGNCCAVNSLQLTLYENQILALLGHNGAGKSTTISMLVGLIPPTSGDALVFGKNILTDMNDIHKDLGVCPQSDILFPELSVKEHLELFGVLKGVKEDVLERVVTDMIDEVGLSDKANTLVSCLSGGMKRKLSLGIALIGDSKVIILDEPTSGMDPYSMRLTWQLIKKIKKGRIVLLTTHSMDEAEALGDRIAIMANGSLKCCGSSLFLKHQYGVGYTLTLVKTAPGASFAADIVHRHIPAATVVSEVGTEISFKLPLTSSSCFEEMFKELESCMKRSTSNSKAGASEDECVGIESYGISVTTLLNPTLVKSCNAIDKEALLEFKRGIEYDSGGQLRTWNPKTDCCTSWNQVTCDNTTGRVIRISPFRPSNPMDLDISIFVNGTLSPFLGNLTYLQELDLAHFQQFYLDTPAGIRGPIPPQLGQLSQLTYLSLAQNILSGSIPSSFAKLRLLKTLNLSYNKLSRTIPINLFQSMKSLNNLYLEQNKFTGSIPSSIVNLISLERLDLTNNSFSGDIPSSIGKLKNLESIELSYNKFTGIIPNSLSELSKLDTLKLDHNKLSGSIPAPVLNLKKLVTFDVSNNQLSGRIPPHSSSFPASSFAGNPGLCDAPLPPCKRV